MAILKAPALLGQPIARRDRPYNGSNHHRYGEVKTRLTIEASNHFAALSPDHPGGMILEAADANEGDEQWPSNGPETGPRPSVFAPWGHLE
jgi:hypothetical protein